MKTKFIFIIILAIISASFISAEKKKKFAPPGTVKISDKLYFDETEITNFHWWEYLSWQKVHYGDSSAEYKNSLPDTTVWLDSAAYNLPYVNYYLRHAAYKDYPVVGVTYEQAVAFCNWRTDRVREVCKHQNPKKYIPKTFQYRLPTKQEWETIAKAGYSEKTRKKLENKYAGYCRNNLKRTVNKNTSSGNNNPDVTAPVYSYWENSYGVYQIIGNVAEMISEKGIAKGGGWVHKENEVTVEKDFTYDSAKSWLGFRCVCEIIEE